MAYLRYVHARADGPSALHLQATGDAFPQGYASGNLSNLSNEVMDALKPHVPSMRVGSDAQYTPCIVEGESVFIPSKMNGLVKVCTVVQLVNTLGAPCPQYSPSDTAAVRAQVAATLTASTEPEPSYDDEVDDDWGAEDEDDCDLDTDEPFDVDVLAEGIAQAIRKAFKK